MTSQFIGYSVGHVIPDGGHERRQHAVRGLLLRFQRELAPSGGSLASASQYIGYSGTGTFTQTGETNTVATTLTLGGSNGGAGTYNLQKAAR